MLLFRCCPFNIQLWQIVPSYDGMRFLSEFNSTGLTRITMNNMMNYVYLKKPSILICLSILSNSFRYSYWRMNSNIYCIYILLLLTYITLSVTFFKYNSQCKYFYCNQFCKNFENKVCQYFSSCTFFYVSIDKRICFSSIILSSFFLTNFPFF